MLEEYFFTALSKKRMLPQEEFLTWCRFIDGYYVRKNDEEPFARKLKKEFASILKENKDVEERLKQVFTDIESSYDRNKVASWIESGFITRKPFGAKLESICSENFNIIEENMDSLFFKSTVPKNVYLSFNDTRNYYAHFKVNKENVMDIGQIHNSLDMLFSIIISIFLHELGFVHSEVKELLESDNIVSNYRLGE